MTFERFDGSVTYGVANDDCSAHPYRLPALSSRARGRPDSVRRLALNQSICSAIR